MQGGPGPHDQDAEHGPVAQLQVVPAAGNHGAERTDPHGFMMVRQHATRAFTDVAISHRRDTHRRDIPRPCWGGMLRRRQPRQGTVAGVVHGAQRDAILCAHLVWLWPTV